MVGIPILGGDSQRNDAKVEWRAVCHGDRAGGLFRPGASSPGDGKDAGQARRLLAIAAVLDGSSREEAARIGGMNVATKLTRRFGRLDAHEPVATPLPNSPFLICARER